MLPPGLGEQGLYHEGACFLSRMTLLLGDQRRLLLSSTVIETNELMAVDLTNPDCCIVGEGPEGAQALPKGTAHVFRSVLLWEGGPL